MFCMDVNLLILAAGLGLAGIDVLGALTILALLSAGLSRRAIALFAVVVFFITTAMGVVLSLTLGDFVDDLARFAHNLPNAAWIAIDSVVVLTLWGWAIKRWYRQRKHQQKKKEATVNRWLRYGPVVIGVAFSISALTDPSFLAIVALAGHNGTLATTICAHAIWVVVSQLPLFVLAGAVVGSRHERLTGWFQEIWKKYSEHISLAVTIIIAGVGLVFAVDLIFFILTQRWLF